CIPSPGTSGARRPISRRSATPPGRDSGPACRRWVRSPITSLPRCPGSRPRGARADSSRTVIPSGPPQEGPMILRSALLVLLAAAPLAPAGAPAQTKDDTLVYALQSDVQTWDPPNSVLRESIILGYHVFDHLAARDLKTGKVGPSLAVSWKNVDDTTWEVK